MANKKLIESLLTQAFKRDEAILSSLGFDAINRAGNVNIWQIHAMMQYPEIKKIPKNPQVSKPKQDSIVLAVIAQEINVNRHFYSYVKDNLTDFRLKFSSSCQGTGTKSYTLLRKLEKVGEPRVKATSVTTFVCIDNVSRRSLELPPTWKNIKGDTEKLSKSEPLTLPKKLFEYNVTVAPSHEDYNRHTNQRFYIQFCMDAGALACSQGFYNGFHGDLLAYHTKRQQIIFHLEAFSGDALTVKTWESVTNPSTLCFIIFKKDKRVFECISEFYPLQESKL